MIDINTLTREEFDALPLVIEGESKEVRYAGHGLVVIRFKPTIYSFTANRCAEVPGSDVLRLRATAKLRDVLDDNNIAHAYRAVNDRWVMADLVMPHPVEFAKYGLEPFVPDDIDVAAMSVAPPIEVIVKRFHGGTSKHRYVGMCDTRVRASHRFYGGMLIEAEQAYPAPIVRFDWRNPIQLDDKRIPDEALPADIADWYIDTAQARSTALRVYSAMETFFGPRDVVVNDVCLFITEDGETVYGEISQDCGRFRHFDLGSLDKDVWRAGGSHADVLAKWQTLLDIMNREV